MKVLCLPLLALAFQAQASDFCDKAVTTPEIDQCGKLKYEQADHRLNAVYEAALNRVDEISDKQQRRYAKRGLIEAQRLWVKFRDKDCSSVYDFWLDGTIRGSMYWGCMLRHTEERTKDLELLTVER